MSIRIIRYTLSLSNHALMETLFLTLYCPSPLCTQIIKKIKKQRHKWLCFLIPPVCLESCVSLNTVFHLLLWTFFKVSGDCAKHCLKPGDRGRGSFPHLPGFYCLGPQLELVCCFLFLRNHLMENICCWAF